MYFSLFTFHFSLNCCTFAPVKRIGLYIIILLGVLLAAGCHDSFELPVDPTPTPTPQPRAEAERTVIVYMAGDNSLSSFAQNDTTEMAKGKDMIPEDVNFIIFFDNKKNKPAIYELSQKKGMQLWMQYEEEQCSTDADVMLGALRVIEHYFPARHYGITFWSHATGWAPERSSSKMKTFGRDDSQANTSGKFEMEIPVLRDVLAKLPKFDYIFFDACFMQSIEVAYELRNVTDWIIGSPAEIPGPGAPYQKIIEALCQGDHNGIVQGYDSGYPDGVYTGVLLSCIDCAKLEELAAVTGQMLTPFYMERTEQSTSGFQIYCSEVSKYTYCFDMRTTMCQLLSEEDYATWMETFVQAVPLRTHSSTNQWYARTISYPYEARIWNPECYGGVSMFVPLNAYNAYGWNEAFHTTSWYEAAGWAATGW